MATIKERATAFAIGYAGATHLKHGYVRGAKEQQMVDFDIALKSYCKHDCEDFWKECPNRQNGKFCVEYRKFKEVLEQAVKGGKE